MKSERLEVLVVIGTRPEVLKMGPVIQALSRNTDRISYKVCMTSQHRELAAHALEVFGIVPDFDLDVMTGNQSPSHVAASVLERIDPILKSEEPNWMLVQGDTTTVAAASLAAFYRHVQIGHVEAGLRTHDRFRPFPEEVHRRMVAVMADLHFAPTERARRNLLAEGIPEKEILVTGNTIVDAVKWVASLPLEAGRLPIPQASPRPRILLVTMHRRESFGGPLENICRALGNIAKKYGDEVLIVYPVHMNPNVHGPVHRLLGSIPNIRLIEPLDYLTFVHLLRESYLVLTDSGGVQEEAPSFGKPILVLRELTERPENIESGAARIVGFNHDDIVAVVSTLLDQPDEYSKMSGVRNPFGDGMAAERIVDALLAAGKNTETIER